MLSYSEYLTESEKHKDGSYASLHLDAASTKALDAFVKSYKFKNPVPAEKQHCTVMYSTKPLLKQGSASEAVSIPATVKGFKILGGDGTSNTLVVTLECEGATAYWKKFRSMGASWDYPSYIPHISVAYEVGDMKAPKLDKELKLHFNRIEVTPLATDWKEKEGLVK
jgi:hypothetical protein